MNTTTTTITAEHVGRTARTLLAGTNHGGTTEIATGAVVVIERVDLPLSYLDASEPGRARVLVRSVQHGVVCTMDAQHLQLLTETVGPRTWWICTNWLKGMPKGAEPGVKIAGPFRDQDEALENRSRIERYTEGRTFYVDSEANQ